MQPQGEKSDSVSTGHFVKRRKKLIIALGICILLVGLWIIITPPTPQPLELSFTFPTGLEPITSANVTQIKKIGSVRESSNSIVFSPIDNQLAATQYEHDIYIFNPLTGSPLTTLKTENWPRSMLFSQDGHLLAVTTALGTAVEIWDIANQQKIASFKLDNRVGDIAFNPDGTQIATAILGNGPDGDGAIWVWNVATKQKLFELKDHTDWVYAIAFRPDGKELASANADGTVRLWNTATGQETAILKDHTDAVSDVEYNPTGSILISASNDNTLRLWSVENHQVLHILRGHTREVKSIAINDDGKMLASTSLDYTVRLCDTQSGAQLLEIPFQNKILGFGAIQFSHDGKLLIIDVGFELQLWGISTTL